jgi:nicotinate dehydrogenase subunit B
VADLSLLVEYKRREFLKVLASGASLTVPVELQGAETRVHVRRAADGKIDAFTGKIDMGQGLRTLLSQCVANELGVPVEEVRLVMGDTDLTPDDGGTWASLTTPETVPAMRKDAATVRGAPVREPKDWTALGKSQKNLNGRDIVTGAFRYNSDVKVDGMWHGVVLRPAEYRARLVAAEGQGVVREGDFAGVCAPTLAEARALAGKAKAEWAHETLPAFDKMIAAFKAEGKPPVENNQVRYPPLIRRGDAEKALASAAQRKSLAFTLAPIAHAALEPRSAIASFGEDGRLTIRCGKQAPFVVRAEVAKAMGMKETDVRIIVDMPGGGFGGKQRSDIEVEAARLAKATGKTVRVEWSRAEEFVWSYARPAALIETETGVDASGRIVSWRQRNYNAGAPGLRPPYDFADHSNEFWASRAPLRQGSYRALAATGNNFARESTVDEWAATLKRDPLEYRLTHIADQRLKAALEMAAQRFGYRGRKAGVGLACNLEKDGRMALFVECAMEPFRILRMTCVADFGAALNPSNLQNQVQGALIMGIGGALWERLEFDAARQLTARLTNYRVPRFTDVPAMDVHIVDRREITAAGAGEAGITLTAPALAAAIFSLTGKRPTAMPMLTHTP